MKRPFIRYTDSHVLRQKNNRCASIGHIEVHPDGRLVMRSGLAPEETLTILKRLVDAIGSDSGTRNAA